MRGLVAGFGLLVAASMGGAVNAQKPDAQLIGETVTLDYVADPQLGYGRFRLVNQTPAALSVNVHSAWLELGSRRQPLEGVTVFNTATGLMVDPAAFEVEAMSAMTFLLGFPRLAYEPHFGESVAVGLQLTIGGQEMGALSPIVFVRRLPAAR